MFLFILELDKSIDECFKMNKWKVNHPMFIFWGP